MKKPYLKISRLAEDQDLNQGALAALIGGKLQHDDRTAQGDTTLEE